MRQDRRKFIKDSVTATAVAAAAPMFVPRSAWGANERLTYGLIGSGGRGRAVSKIFQQLGAQCVAVADVYEPSLQAGLKEAPGAKSYVDYKDLLGQSGIDMVLIATPDHQHYPNLIDSLAAKKDVYLEKPMSHSL